MGVFSIDQKSGRLAWVQSQPAMGKTPRFFALPPNGRWQCGLNEESDAIVVFAVDPASGRLNPAGLQFTFGSPVCMVFSNEGRSSQT